MRRKPVGNREHVAARLLRRNENLYWKTGIGALLVLITFLHYWTSTDLPHVHQFYQVLYFLPIILAGMRFGLAGGSGTAVIVTALYLPHVFLQWGGASLANLARFLMLFLYNVVGAVTGYLASRERRERERYQRTAEELSAAYAQLKENSERLALAEAELLHMDRLAVLGEMAASVAHEIRNPLGSIRGAAEILGAEKVDDETRRRFSEVILREVGRLNSVVENYLGVARRRAVSSQSVDVRAIVELVSQLVQTQARRRRVRIDTRLPRDSVQLSLDPGSLQQVLLNLALNAITASPPGETAEISLERTGTGCRIEVSDRGPGIPDSLREKIWEPFFTTRENGTGLGLAIVRRIAKKMGWKVEYLENPQGGATFVVSIEG